MAALCLTLSGQLHYPSLCRSVWQAYFRPAGAKSEGEEQAEATAKVGWIQAWDAG